MLLLHLPRKLATPGDLFGAGGGLFGAPAAPAGWLFGAGAAPEAGGGLFGAPAAEAGGARAPADVGAVAASARPNALGKKWEKELAELDAMGLAVYRDGMPELLEQTNGSIAKVLELLMP